MVQSEEHSDDPKFDEPVHVFDQTSGILDGKLYQRRPLYQTDSAASLNSSALDSATNRDNQQGDKGNDRLNCGVNNSHQRESEFVYATVCALGAI